MGGPLDPLGQGVDVEAVVVQLDEDGLELGQGIGVAGFAGRSGVGGWSWWVLGGLGPTGHLALGEGGDQRGAGGCVGGGADEVHRRRSG